MRKHTITDAEAQQLLSGETPAGRPELDSLAASISDVRRASLEVAPQPSEALAAYLEQPALGVSAGTEPTPLKGIKKMVAPFSGLGIAAKIAAATGVLALGITGVGAAGALPGGAQQAFDDVVSTIVPSEETSDGGSIGDGALDDCVVNDGVAEEGATEGDITSTVDDGTDEGAETCVDEVLPVGSKEFSAWVVQGAQDPDKVGSEFGERVSEQARELKDEKADERAENGGNGGNGRPDGVGGQNDDESEGDSGDSERGKPEGTPGGRP